MPFETFTRTRVPVTTEPYATIQKGGTAFSLNAAAFQALGSPKAVELLYDRDERLIGLRKVAPSTPHAYEVRGQGKRPDAPSNWLIAGRAFTQYYEIDTSVARRWPADERDGMLVIDLKDPGTEVFSNRNRRREGVSAGG